jgi:hypothetical protein
MTTSFDLQHRGNQVSFLLFLTVLFVSINSFAQTPTPVFARVISQKVPPGKEQEFEKFMMETFKPVHELRKQKGKIISWYLFKVHFAGASDEYNYVTVQYYNTWAKTEADDDWTALIKEQNAKADPVAVRAKLRELRTVVREHLYYREETVDPKTPAPFKYVMIEFMKVKPGMLGDYMKVEKDEWKPFHQHLADNGTAAGWGLWALIFPGGTSRTHDFVTSSRYSTYTKLSEVDYGAMFKAVYPSKDPQAAFDRAEKARDLVRSELWEVISQL